MRLMMLLSALTALACSSDPFPIVPDSSAAAGGGGSGGGVVGGSDVGGDATGGDGAGGSEMQALGYENGERLRARVRVGSDGSRQFAGWWDTERGEACSFQTAFDGSLRCLPAAALTPYYSDPACAQPIYPHTQAACTAPLPAYARENKSLCNGSGELRALGGTISPPTVYVMTAAGGPCLGTPASANTTYYLLSAPLADSAFVQAVEEVE